MCCDNYVHNELISMKQYTCPFCDEFIGKEDKCDYSCCKYKQIEDVNGIYTCVSCGLVYNSINKDDYIDFHENLFKFRRKSIYIRKYYIENTLNNLLINNGIELTYQQRCKIYKIFEQIECILPAINKKRRRIININYIIQKILVMMNSKYKIPVTKSIKTMKFYDEYWNRIMSIIGHKIEAIIYE